MTVWSLNRQKNWLIIIYFTVLGHDTLLYCLFKLSCRGDTMESYIITLNSGGVMCWPQLLVMLCRETLNRPLPVQTKQGQLYKTSATLLDTLVIQLYFFVQVRWCCCNVILSERAYDHWLIKILISILFYSILFCIKLIGIHLKRNLSSLQFGSQKK